MKNSNCFQTKLRSAVLVGSLFGIVLFFSPHAHAQKVPSYDNNITNGDAGYSRTTGSDGAGGYVENTYYTSPNGVRKTVQIRRYNKGDNVKSPSYEWLTYGGPNGSTINVTIHNHRGEGTYTKEEIDSGGGRTVYNWSKGGWHVVSYTKPESNGLRTVLQAVGVGLDIAGGTSIGHSDHKHERHSSHSTTTHAGCKCHPCTCSPCRCHA
jgi:hypothetical protein